MAFYLKDSDQEYFSKFWAEERKYLGKFGCRLLTVDEANTHSFDDLVIKRCKGIVGSDAIKPKLSNDYNYFCIPYELGETIGEELVPETIISQLINNNLDEPIFIASTDANFGCFGKCPYINEDIIWSFFSSHLNTPFIIFDSKKDVFALIDYDLPLQIIGYKNNILDSENYIKNKVGYDGWITVFNRYAHYTNMPYILDNYYKFLLPKKVSDILNSMTVPHLRSCTQE